MTIRKKRKSNKKESKTKNILKKKPDELRL